jgi:hypothetical protein
VIRDPKEIDATTDAIREIYRNDPVNAESAIESRLDADFAGMTESEKASFLGTIMEKFKTHPDTPPSPPMEDGVLKEIFLLLLGREIATDTIPAPERLQRLSDALSTLFETLNRIINTIDVTLLGDAAAQQTIRGVIGREMEGDGGHRSLEDHLGRIEKAFLVSHQSFKQAAHTLVAKLLREMDPEGISGAADSRMKFGPLLKAEHFDTYKARFATIDKWFQSGRFMSDLLREFENNCQTSV